MIYRDAKDYINGVQFLLLDQIDLTERLHNIVWSQ